MINVIGLGYIGLPTALMFASHGIEVVGTDYKKEVIETLNSGKMTFKEKGITELFDQAVKRGIRFSGKYIKTDTYIISVPTPYNKTSKKVDPSYVLAAVENILSVCQNDAVLIIESTISPGTIDKFIRPLIEKEGIKLGKDVHLVHAPERIIPGNMVYELKYNSRTIGADSKIVAQKIKMLYTSFCRGEIITTDIRTAEMTKVVENTFRDINIAFANELTKICRVDNMDVYEIIKIANKHPRVNILYPGPGVGGHCISVDPWYLVGDYPGLSNLILQARKVNNSMPEFVLERINYIMQENNIFSANRVGLYGLTYKEDVDDTRESPTLQLLENMKKHLAGGLVQVYDPFVQYDIADNQYHNLYEFLDRVDLVVIMVGHSEIREHMDLLEKKIVLDTRNVFIKENVQNLYHL